ncbi:hypothetical protein RZS28_15925 [Methylocapsa polymorpha]|uniref:Lipoprotein n=1 Tax=Methylocapsa polymorpha TaxID=3080828 RepID=A0ABZ0HSA0_9HYPH|nr:hypothetical protein RZS28_15925 [Methylocapsa sp. RX1]
MRLAIGTAASFGFGMILAGCAISSQLGLDPITGTLASPIRLPDSVVGYEIICDQGTRFCMMRAEAICGGPDYRIADRPSEAPRVQALIDEYRFVPVNTSNPYIIRIVCG